MTHKVSTRIKCLYCLYQVHTKWGLVERESWQKASTVNYAPLFTQLLLSFSRSMPTVTQSLRLVLHQPTLSTLHEAMYLSFQPLSHTFDILSVLSVSPHHHEPAPFSPPSWRTPARSSLAEPAGPWRSCHARSLGSVQSHPAPEPGPGTA